MPPPSGRDVIRNPPLCGTPYDENRQIVGAMEKSFTTFMMAPPHEKKSSKEYTLTRTIFNRSFILINYYSYKYTRHANAIMSK